MNLCSITIIHEQKFDARTRFVSEAKMTRENVFTYIEGTAALKMQEGASDRTARILSLIHI